jgi:hypothetical protein
MFDNNGNPTTGNIVLATLTGNANAGGGGRGDGTGFHGNGRDAYVVVNSAGGAAWVTVLNDNGTLRWSRKASEDFETVGTDRVDAAIAFDGRVIAVFDEANTTPVRLPQARMFAANGVPIGNRFYISERDQPAPAGLGLVGERVRVAWRENSIAMVWQSDNSPDTFDTVAALRIFDVATPILITSIVDNGTTVTINWTGGGPTYSVLGRGTLTAAPSTLVSGLSVKTYTTPKTENQAYYEVSSP